MNVRPERVVLDQETYDFYMKQARRERAEAFAWVFGGLASKVRQLFSSPESENANNSSPVTGKPCVSC